MISGISVGGKDEYLLHIDARTNTDKQLKKIVKKGMEFSTVVGTNVISTLGKDGFITTTPVLRAGPFPGPFMVKVSPFLYLKAFLVVSLHVPLCQRVRIISNRFVIM